MEYDQQNVEMVIELQDLEEKMVLAMMKRSHVKTSLVGIIGLSSDPSSKCPEH